MGRDFNRGREFGEDVARMIDSEMKLLIESCYEKAQTILRENRDKLNIIAQKLLEQETIEGEELDKILTVTVD